MRHRWLAGALVVLAAAATYGSTIDNYFAQDDFGVVWLLSRKPADYFPRWFVTPWMDDIWGFMPDEVRPFVAVSYQLAAAFGPSSPIPNHHLNIAVHAGNGLLVIGLARHAAGCGPAAAMLAGLVFVLLPNQAESVAWITGRVDSMPAVFYLAAFLAYVRWRAGAGRALYLWSLAWYFVALFSKQNTVTLPVALVLYDALVARRPVGASSAWLRPYVPYAALTAGYLILRYALFGEAARESLLTSERLGFFVEYAGRHLTRIVFGAERIADGAAWAVACAAVAFVAACFTPGWRGPSSDPRLAPRAVFFGGVWTILGLAPTLVATYISPRHAYLASVGWAITIGIAFEAMWRRRATGASPRTPALTRRRMLAAAAAAALLTGYSARLNAVVADWNGRAALSSRAVADLEREVLAAPEGTLIIVGVPAPSWEYALPFAAQPPFTSTDLTRRATIISEVSLHCCPADQWDAHTRARLREWLVRPDAPPVIAMYWDPQTGRRARLSDRDDPSLRMLMHLLLSSGDPAALASNIHRLLADFVAFHGRAVTGD